MPFKIKAAAIIFCEIAGFKVKTPVFFYHLYLIFLIDFSIIICDNNVINHK